MTKKIASTLVLTMILTITAPAAEPSDDANQEACKQALDLPWKEVFFDSGSGDWSERWFVDGYKGEIRNTPEGMFYAAGPIAGDHASHTVLWTRESFAGPIKLEFDFTRLDTVNQYVNIIYLQATGTGEGPYDKDISKWIHLRAIPRMSTYYDNMNLLHVSLAAYGQNAESVENSYIRARRYPRSLFGGNFKDTMLKPEFLNTGLFLPGVTYHVILVKTETDLFMQISNDETKRLYRWDLAQIPPIHEGRVGIRQMWQRAALFANISISQIESSSTNKD